MKIIDNRARENIKMFSELSIGETFCTASKDKVFMKTEKFCEVYDDGWYRDSCVLANAFCLNDGTRKRFLTHETVIPLNCECVITNK